MKPIFVGHMNEQKQVPGEPDSRAYYIAVEMKAVQTCHRVNTRSKKQKRVEKQTQACLETIQKQSAIAHHWRRQWTVQCKVL